VVLQCVTASGQIYDKTIIHAGDSISKYYTYLFPSFEDATVIMRDGRSAVYKMNFNLLLCDLEFINQKGDTLAVTNAMDIYSIRLDSCSFIYVHKKGYFQILATGDASSLVVHRQRRLEHVPVGGMGAGGPGGGLELYKTISTRQGIMPLVLHKDICVWRITSFLVFNSSGEMENAGRTAFMKIYDGDKRSFEQFVKENKIDFNRQDDLEKLFHFCTQ